MVDLASAENVSFVSRNEEDNVGKGRQRLVTLQAGFMQQQISLGRHIPNALSNPDFKCGMILTQDQK